MGGIFLALVTTGITKYIIKHFPISMRAGILLGAGFASLMRVFDPSQPFMGKIPMSFSIAALGSFFILFSAKAIRFRNKYSLFAWIASFGIAPRFLIGYAVGLISGEIPLPTGVFDRFFIEMPLQEDVCFFFLVSPTFCERLSNSSETYQFIILKN